MPVGSDNQGCYLSNLQENLTWRDKVLAAVLEKNCYCKRCNPSNPVTSLADMQGSLKRSSIIIIIIIIHLN